MESMGCFASTHKHDLLAIGIYPPIKPMHPGRWAPLGINTEVLVQEISECDDCRKTMDCHCIREHFFAWIEWKCCLLVR